VCALYRLLGVLQEAGTGCKGYGPVEEPNWFPSCGRRRRLGSGLVLQRASPKETFFFFFSFFPFCSWSFLGTRNLQFNRRPMIQASYSQDRRKQTLSSENDSVMKGPTLEFLAAGQVNGRPRCFACCTRSIDQRVGFYTRRALEIGVGDCC
jgi:hypothetical protein